jgi:hypothetical protein
LWTVSCRTARPPSVTKGDTFSVTTGTITNIGDAVSGNYTVALYASTSISTLFASGINLGSVNKDSLAVGGSTTATLSNISTSSLEADSSYYIGWRISGVADETDTNNNTGYCTTAMSVINTVVTQLPTPTIEFVLELGGSGTGEIIVTWSNIPNADSYVIEYSTSSTFTWWNTQQVSSADTWELLTGFDANVTYYFRVMAIGSGTYTDSDWSSITSAKTPVPPADSLDSIS